MYRTIVTICAAIWVGTIGVPAVHAETMSKDMPSPAFRPIRMPADKSDWQKSQPQAVGGIPFRTVDPTMNVGYEQKVQVTIGLGNVSALYFLVSSGGDLPKNVAIAQMKMTYASGKEELLPLVTGKTTYYRASTLGDFPVSKAGNYRIPWSNPHLDDPIMMVAFEGTDKTGTETRCEGITAQAEAAGFREVGQEAMGKALRAKERRNEEEW